MKTPQFIREVKDKIEQSKDPRELRLMQCVLQAALGLQAARKNLATYQRKRRGPHPDKGKQRPRGECPFCHKIVQLNPEGKLYRHDGVEGVRYRYGSSCDGYRKKPL